MPVCRLIFEVPSKSLGNGDIRIALNKAEFFVDHDNASDFKLISQNGFVYALQLSKTRLYLQRKSAADPNAGPLRMEVSVKTADDKSFEIVGSKRRFIAGAFGQEEPLEVSDLEVSCDLALSQVASQFNHGNARIVLAP